MSRIFYKRIIVFVLSLSICIAIFAFFNFQNNTHSSYQISLTSPSEISVNKTSDMKLLLSTNNIGNKGYENVSMKVSSPNKTLSLWLNEENLSNKNADDNNTLDILKVGFLGEENFSLSNFINLSLALDVLATESGEYSITFELVNLNNNSILTSKTINFYVINL